MHLHRLVVTADSEIYGIVTQTDIARSIRTELERLQAERQTSTAELDTLIRYVMEDLERLQMFLNETSNLSAVPNWTVCTALPSEARQTLTDTEVSCPL